MAITTTISRTTVQGDDRIVYGKSVLSGTSSEEVIITGLSSLDFISVGVKSSTPAYVSVEGDLPATAGSVTVKVSANDQTLYWKAEGK